MQSMKGTYQMSKSRILCLAAALFAGSAFADSAITINEVMAKNTTKLATASGVKGIDWVELRNSGSQPVDLSGWYLGNDPTKKTSKWPKIEGSCVVPANGYKIVWCDGDGACTSWAADEAHVACNISTDAGKHTMFLASAADTAAIVTQVPLREGLEDISYGYASSTDDYRYFTTPTPGAANASAGRTGFTPKVAFSVPHGYKDAPFQLTLSCPEKPGAQIYYTLNGRKPTVGGSGSTLYTGPITISKTTVVRAAVPDADSLRQNDTSASYLFVADILTQTVSTRPEGFPNGGVTNNDGELQKMGYGMRAASKLGDVDAATATARLYNGFTNGIRTVSLVFDPDDMFDVNKGIYVNARKEGRDWERPTMAEQIYPVDTNDEFSVSCGIRIRGAFSRMGYAKHAFRLFFRSEYGMSSLNHPLFGDEGPKSFGKIDLRCDQNSSWVQTKADTTLIHEVWVRDTQRDMGQPYNKSRYYHLFLNGCYWGIYQTEERVDQKYCADTIGGEEDNFDVVRTSNTGGQNYTTGIVEGDTTSWSNFWHITMKEGYGKGHEDNYYRVRGLNPDGSRNPNYPIYLNVTNLICYMLSAHYTIDTDAPVNSATKKQNNIIGYRNRVDGESDFDGFLWNRHDAENALFHPSGKAVNTLLTDIIRLGTRDYGRTELEHFGPSMLNWELCQNAEYRRIFGDLVQKMIISPNGAMAPKASKARYRARMAEIDDAVMAELARWGGNANYERIKSWIPACEKDLSFFDQRTPYLLQAYRDSKINFFPSVDAAKVLDASSVELGDGDKLDAGNRVYLTGSNVGTVYYTTDGSDPCLRDGSVSDKALVYSGTSTSGGLEVPAQGLKIMARIKTSTEWSALSEVAIVTDESQVDEPEPEKTVYSGVYNEPIVFSADESCIFSNATLNAGLVVEDGVTAKLKAAPDTVNTISSISAPNGEVRLTGEGTVKLEGTDTLMTVSNLVVKSGVLQVKSIGVSATKTPVINVLGFVEQTGGVIDMDLGFASANQVYGIYLANKDPKGADGKALGLVYARFDGGTFNAVVGATKSSAVYVDKGSVEATFKGGQVLDVVLKGTEPRFISAAGDISFKNCKANVTTSDASVSGARAFKSDKRITFGDVDGHFVANLTGPDAEVFSAADKIRIDAGTFELVASDDCFSAMTNITVNGGLVYAVSTGNDVFDSNGDMELNGGTILAFATAEGHEAFDVDPEQTESGASVHQLRINGGTIFATGGKTADWPNNLVATCDVYAAEDLDASAYSGKYVSVSSTVGVKTTVKFPVFPQTKCAVLVTCPYMTGSLTCASAAPAAGSQGFHDLYVEGLVETNQDQLRFCEIYGSTADGLTGDTGEYIVLTNISDKVVQLAGLKVNVEKLADYDKSGESASKCLFTLTGGEVPAYGSVRLDQATYWNGEKKKITNGDIYVALTDSTGATVQSGKASFDNAKYPGVDGEGASLIAISFDTLLKDNADCWVSSAGPATDPEQPGTDPEQPGTDPEQPGTDPEQPGTEGDGHEGVQLWANGPYWATMNCGASEATRSGYYYLNNTDTIGYAVKDDALTGSLVRNASETLWGDGWRLPTTAETKLIKENCSIVSTGTDAAGQPYVVVQGKTAGYTDKQVVFPLGGYGNGGSVSASPNRWGTYGKYWTSDTGIANRLCFGLSSSGGYFEYANGGDVGHGNYYMIRLVRDTAPQGGSTPTHTHNWGAPTYAWTQTASGWSCTGTSTCSESGCTVGTKTKTVAGVYSVVTPATTAAAGVGRYTATFNESPFVSVETKDVEIAKLHEHVYGTATYSWSSDHSTCTATASCTSNGCAEKLTETVAATKNVTKEPTLDETGTCVYTATFTNAKFVQQTATVTLAKLPSGPDGHGYEYVQLWENGPYWAKVNVGATSETDFGTFFSWGSTSGSAQGATTAFNGNCVTMNKSVNDLATYLDANGNLKSAYDAASVNMGGDWRMPTAAEMSDLVAKCDVSWDDSLKGTWVKGRGDYASEKIFLPNGGFYQNGGNLGNVGSYGFYLSSTPNSNTTQAKAFQLMAAVPLCVAACNRNNGYPVRAVLPYVPGSNPGTPTHTHSWGTPTYSWSADNASCTATVTCTGDASHQETETKASVRAVVTAATATTDGLARYTVTFAGERFTTQTKDVVIPKTGSGSSDPTPGADADVVQLWENGPYWAKTNLGAESESGTGDFYMWGGTVGYTKEGTAWTGTDGSSKSNPFGSSVGKDKSVAALTSAGIIGADGILEKAYDAANATLGGDWRLPTKAEIEAMTTNCTFTAKTVGGVKGLEVRGKGAYADNAIFLPCTGYGEASNGSLNNVNGQTYYLTATPADNTTQFSSMSVTASTSTLQTQNANRNNGYQIRPVRDTAGSTTPDTTWDVPGATGGINAKVDAATGKKTIEFTSIAYVDGKLTVGFAAGKVDANGQVFGLICKESLASAETFVINVTLTDDGTGSATVGSLEGLTDKPSLFVLGIGPAK